MMGSGFVKAIKSLNLATPLNTDEYLHSVRQSSKQYLSNDHSPVCDCFSVRSRN